MKHSVVGWAKRAALGLLLVGTLVSAAEAKGRKFYLTKDSFDGDEVLTACARGYHMASFYEIRDTSNLTYDTKLGVTREDSGSGPPANLKGWIRTGRESLTGILNGANCGAWTSDAHLANGTSIYLETIWTGASTVISPWKQTGVLSCDTPQPIWCVSNK